MGKRTRRRRPTMAPAAWVLAVFVLASASVLAAMAPGATDGPERAGQADGKLLLLDEAAAALYRAAKDGRMEEAREQLERFSDMVTRISYGGLTTLEGLNALTSLVAESREIYNRVRLDRVKALEAAVKIRLAADALTHREKPMWLGYRDAFGRDAARLKEAIDGGRPEEARRALKAFYDHYLLIRPAVLISRSASLAEQLDSWFIFMNGLLAAGDPGDARLKEGAKHADRLIDDLFRADDEPAAAGAGPAGEPVRWAAIVCGAIVSVLVYVGYRKYRAPSGA